MLNLIVNVCMMLFVAVVVHMSTVVLFLSLIDNIYKLFVSLIRNWMFMLLMHNVLSHGWHM